MSESYIVTLRGTGNFQIRYNSNLVIGCGVEGGGG